MFVRLPRTPFSLVSAPIVKPHAPAHPATAGAVKDEATKTETGKTEADKTPPAAAKPD